MIKCLDLRMNYLKNDVSGMSNKSYIKDQVVPDTLGSATPDTTNIMVILQNDYAGMLLADVTKVIRQRDRQDYTRPAHRQKLIRRVGTNLLQGNVEKVVVLIERVIKDKVIEV